MNIEQINERIDLMIGSYSDNEKLVESLSLSERISARDKYRKHRERLVKIAEKCGEKSLQLTLVGSGALKHGVTPGGKKIVWYGNNGMTERSRYCGTLVINGETIFTSGTVARAFEYILNN